MASLNLSASGAYPTSSTAQPVEQGPPPPAPSAENPSRTERQNLRPTKSQRELLAKQKAETERIRNEMPSILQLFYSVEISGGIGKAKLDSIQKQIAEDPAQNALQSSNRLLTYARSILELLGSRHQPFRIQRIGSIPIRYLREYALTQFAYNCLNSVEGTELMITHLKTQDDIVLRNSVAALIVANEKTSVESRLRAFDAMSDIEARHDLVKGLIAHSQYASIHQYEVIWPALVERIQDEKLKHDAVSAIRFIGKQREFELLRILHIPALEQRRENLLAFCNGIVPTYAALMNLERINPPQLRAELRRHVVALGQDGWKDQFRLEGKKMILQNDGYESLAPHDVDLLVADLIASVDSVPEAIPFIGHVSNEGKRNELFQRVLDHGDAQQTHALFFAAMHMPEPDRSKKSLELISLMANDTSTRFFSESVGLNELEAINRLDFALQSSIIDVLAGSSNTHLVAALGTLAEKLDSSVLRNRLLDRLRADDDPDRMLEADIIDAKRANIEDDPSSFALFRQRIIDRFQSGGITDCRFISRQELHGLLFEKQDDKFIRDMLPLIFRQTGQSGQMHNVRFLVSLRDRDVYPDLIQNILRTGDVATLHFLLDEWANSVRVPLAVERDLVAAVKNDERDFLGTTVGVAAKKLAEFWDDLAAAPALQSEFQFFLRTLQHANIPAIGDQRGIGALKAMCMLDQFGRSGAELWRIEADFKNFHDFAIAHCASFPAAVRADYSESEMSALLMRHRNTIRQIMIVFGKSIFYDAFKKKEIKFLEFIDKCAYLLLDNEIIKLAHEIGKIVYSPQAELTEEAKTRAKTGGKNIYNTYRYTLAAGDAYPLTLMIDSYLKSGQRPALIEQLEDFLGSDQISSKCSNLLASTLLSLSGIDIDDHARAEIGDLFDLRYLYLIVIALQRLPDNQRQRLKDITQSTIDGRFANWLATEPTISRVNQETCRLFEKHGLNFKLWLDPELVSVGGDNNLRYSLQAWQRQPGKDLFMGTYVGSCVALDGENPGAILEALLFQVVQHLEIIDEKSKETLGKVLMYWAQLEGYDRPVLIADHISVRPQLRSSVPLRNHIVDWMQQLAQKVSGRTDQVPIFWGTLLSFMTTVGLEIHKAARLSVIGKTDNNLLYANALNRYDDWADISRPHDVELWELKKVEVQAQPPTDLQQTEKQPALQENPAHREVLNALEPAIYSPRKNRISKRNAVELLSTLRILGRSNRYRLFYDNVKAASREQAAERQKELFVEGRSSNDEATVDIIQNGERYLSEIDIAASENTQRKVRGMALADLRKEYRDRDALLFKSVPEGRGGMLDKGRKIGWTAPVLRTDQLQYLRIPEKFDIGLQKKFLDKYPYLSLEGGETTLVEEQFRRVQLAIPLIGSADFAVVETVTFGTDSAAAERRRLFKNEVENFEYLQKNIQGFAEFFGSAIFENHGILVVPFEPLGDVRFFLQNMHKLRLDPDDQRWMRHALALGLVNAILDMHASGIYHRNIAPSNIFIASDGTIRLRDLRFSTRDASAKAPFTVRFPERPHENLSAKSADLHAVGAVIHWLASGHEFDPAVASVSGKTPVKGSTLETAAIGLLSPDPSARPSLEELKRELMRECLSGEETAQNVERLHAIEKSETPKQSRKPGLLSFPLLRKNT
jgi:hypothetical protein